VYYITECLIGLTEQLNGLVLLPPVVVAALQALHLYTCYRFLEYHQLHVAPHVHLLPRLPAYVCYSMFSVAFPHIFLSLLMAKGSSASSQPTPRPGARHVLASKGGAVTAAAAADDAMGSGEGMCRLCTWQPGKAEGQAAGGTEGPG
jgi:hypothetical protein